MNRRRNPELDQILYNINIIAKAEELRDKKRKWFSYWRQEYVDERPLWEHIFGFYDGKRKLPSIEAHYNDTKTRWAKAAKNSYLSNHQHKEMLQVLHTAFRSATLDPRLTVLTVKKKPILVQGIRNAFTKATSKLTRVALSTATAATVAPIIMEITASYYPEFASFMKYIPYDVLARSVTIGTTVTFIVHIWKYWRDSVTRATKAKLLGIQKDIEELKSMRNTRSTRIRKNDPLDQEIMDMERKIKAELDPIFSYATAHSLIPHNLGTTI
jgi:hypothetical protein